MSVSVSLLGKTVKVEAGASEVSGAVRVVADDGMQYLKEAGSQFFALVRPSPTFETRLFAAQTGGVFALSKETWTRLSDVDLAKEFAGSRDQSYDEFIGQMLGF